MNFSQLNLDSRLLSGISALGFVAPTPVQKQAIPLALEGKDVLALAQTGTGKTAAFVLPVLQYLLAHPPAACSVFAESAQGDGIASRVSAAARIWDEVTAISPDGGPAGVHASPVRGGGNMWQTARSSVRALVLAPTRELTKQIEADVLSIGRDTRLRCTTIFGGVGKLAQATRLRAGVDIVAACPGRLLDHVRDGNIDLSRVEVLVLDEADMMFDMGFLPDIRTILELTANRKQTLMYSATMPEPVAALADEAMQKPVRVEVDYDMPAETVEHSLFPVPLHLKTPLLKSIMRSLTVESVLVFTRTRHGAQRLWRQLTNVGFKATCLQGDLSQRRRQDALKGFRSGKYSIMVATDLAARGLDISSITHVINYDFPPSVDAYIHRIGRTGRALRAGQAFTFVTEDDEAAVRTLERALVHTGNLSEGESLERCELDGFNYDERPRVESVHPPKPQRQARRQRKPRAYQLADERDVASASRPARQQVPSATKARVLSKPQVPVEDPAIEPKPASRAVAKKSSTPRKARKAVTKGEE